MPVNPMVWETFRNLSTASGVGHLEIVVTAAIGSTIINYYLAKRGKVVIIKFLNKVLWVASGLIFLDELYNIGSYIRNIFDLF